MALRAFSRNGIKSLSQGNFLAAFLNTRGFATGMYFLIISYFIKLKYFKGLFAGLTLTSCLLYDVTIHILSLSYLN